MRLIDADELEEYAGFLKKRCAPDSEPYKMYASLERMISISPTIDAEPVVHCRDCKYSYSEHGNLFCTTLDDYSAISSLVQPNDFCSWGKRKDNEEVET